MQPDLRLGDCLEVLPTLEAASFDVVLTDPPYPEIDRPYGRMSEADWHAMMRALVPEVRRLLKPTGSAVFILQPNSERVGRMRTWLWEFMAWVGKEWGIVQDAYWWNTQAMATLHCAGKYGLMRPSLKFCVWCGPDDCHRNQGLVLQEPAESTKRDRRRSDARIKYSASGSTHHVRHSRSIGGCVERGAATPMNVLPFGRGGGGRHSASTSFKLCDWWLRYLCPPGGRVLDPFSGSGTVALAALRQGKDCVGVEKMPEYHEIAQKRLREAAPLFSGAAT